MDLSSFGVAVPEIYLRLQSEGLLRYGESREDWKANWKKILQKSPPALYGVDFEWMSADDVVSEAVRTKGRARWRSEWPEDFTFVAFAHTGAGDQWGWAPKLAPGASEAPVIFIEHDSDKSLFVAPDFAGFLFRQALETFVHYPHDPKEMTLEKRVAVLRKSTRTLLEFLPEAQREALEELCDRPVTEVTERNMVEKRGKFACTSEWVHLRVVPRDYPSRIARKLLAHPLLDQPVQP